MHFQCSWCKRQIWTLRPVLSDTYDCACGRMVDLGIGGIAYLWGGLFALYSIPLSLLLMAAARVSGRTIVVVPPMAWTDILLTGLVMVPCVALVFGWIFGLPIAVWVKLRG